MKMLPKIISVVLILIFGAAICGFGQTSPRVITRDDAVKLALRQASNFEFSKFNEQIAAEDVFQARKAFYPKISANPSIIYTTPSLGSVAAGTPRPPSYLGANAITEYQATAMASGEIDISGRLKANQRRALALLQAAKAGTEIARRDLIRATDEAYFFLAFAAAQENAAGLNLQAAQKFEETTKLLIDGGENPPVDLLKAQIQTTTRVDELEQAKINRKISENNLKVFLNLPETEMIAAEDLQTDVPLPADLSSFTIDAVSERPEFAQFAAQKRVAEENQMAAKAERRPQISYSLEAGAISDSLSPNRLGNSAGFRATVSVNLPLFDFGASKSRERQAELEMKLAESSKLFAERQFTAELNSNLAIATAATARIKLLAGNLQKAERVLDVSIARYVAGETQIVEVTDSQNLIVTQRLTLLQAIFDYQIARTRLRQATGKQD